MRLVLFASALLGGTSFAKEADKSEPYFKDLERLWSYGHSRAFYPTRKYQTLPITRPAAD